MTPWTEEKQELLTRLWLANTPTAEMASALKMSRNAVVAKAHRLGLPLRGSPIKPGTAKPKSRTRWLPRVQHTPAPPGAPAQRCQWIDGQPSADDSCKCGRPVMPGGYAPYCPEHHARAYIPAPKARDAA